MPDFKPPKEIDDFFKKLYAIKMIAKTVGECSKEPEVALYMRKIYKMLHELYKTEEEKENEKNIDAIVNCNANNDTC